MQHRRGAVRLRLNHGALEIPLDTKDVAHPQLTTYFEWAHRGLRGRSKQMNRAWLKLFSIFWITIVTPLFGIIPMVILLADPSSDTSRYGVAILRDLRRLMLPDPAPTVSHVALHDLAPKPVWWIMIPAVFFVAFLSGSHLWRSRTKIGNGLP